MAEVLRCQAVEAVPYFKPFASSSYAVVPPKPRRIEFDERPVWKRPYLATFDPVQEFTNGFLTAEQFLQHLVARSPENDTLVDVLFALLRQCAFEDAKEELGSDLLPLLQDAVFTRKMFDNAMTSFRPEFTSVKYMSHLYHVFITMSGYFGSKVRMELYKREKRSEKQRRAAKKSSNTAPPTRTTIPPPSIPPVATSDTPAICLRQGPCEMEQQYNPAGAAPLVDVSPSELRQTPEQTTFLDRDEAVASASVDLPTTSSVLGPSEEQ